ncbi:MAG: Ditrans,polycis-undecaprenyl-diphosphate synthase ((2E,6E)-farnesyl-diphosphate specific) [Phycisphaerae bacterium]|nr:Ditrans,polycis-undecaprenyl-diphosphate synthase ((2E,6E)-farnesyl-diphosphate specific) [Phycisphaerae bacterium]
MNPREILGLTVEQLPRHIAIIMDGNGRWAQQRNLPRIAGHDEGAKVVRTIVTQCARLGLQALTLYSFSTENWKRPDDEINFLMDLYRRYLISERETIMQNNIRFQQIGRRESLPERVLQELDQTTSISRSNTGMRLCLAINYGSRQEMLDAIRLLARQVQSGKIRPEQIDEAHLSAALYTADVPDPDLLIRTAGEQRLSNFLLWQLSYAELYFEAVCWPEFTIDHLHRAIRAFAHRTRRFGGVPAD